ncbi:MAG: NAD(P)-binding domain-containing protein [Myxococcaceae bacterium]|nr:NAD(P)-binding domain-containing protein [Myxococcaceae bacterium]
MNAFPQLLEGRFEGLHLLSDARTSLRALVGIHSTKFGPALGGTRALATYAGEEDAATDVLRLARGMTYKATLAGLPLGGGKAVIMLPRGPFDRVALFEAFGRAVDSLGGRYITTEDSGTSTADMAVVARTTRHVVGLEGRSGDPSPVTAFGVVRGIEAAAKVALGRSDLQGLKVTVLGVGNVGMNLCRELHQRGAKLYVSDIARERVQQMVEAYGAVPLGEAELYAQEADVFAPCALGGSINDVTVGVLRVRVVAGAANNQLLEPRHGAALARAGITYVPDYAINAGGLINVAQELTGYDPEKAYARASRIHDTIEELLTRARKTGERPEQVADHMVEEKLYG